MGQTERGGSKGSHWEVVGKKARRLRYLEGPVKGCASFPLTPPLSLREREPRNPSLELARCVRFAEALTTILPLPKGEGRGEGGQNSRLATAAEVSKPHYRHTRQVLRP